MNKKICYNKCVNSLFKYLAYCPATTWNEHYTKADSIKVSDLKEIPDNCPFKLEHIISKEK